MKNIKRLLAVVAVFALVLAGVLTLVACNETHVCAHKCETCGKCTDKDCKDDVCKEKCEGHTPAAHVCGHKCAICNKCTDVTCTDAACAEKCAGHKPAAHVCAHKCTVEGCGKCKDPNCNDPACASKCPGHDKPNPEHVCASTCPTCDKCLNANCNDPACADKCKGHETKLVSEWYVETTLADKQAESDNYLVSVKLKNAITVAANVVSATVSFPADAAHGFIAVKYSGTATFKGVGLWGTKGGVASAKNGLSVGDVGGWNTQDTSAVGTDFSVLVIKVDGYYAAGEWDIDTVTNIGFSLTGSADDTFTIHGIEVLANKNHSFGEPTPPVVTEPLKIGDLTPGWVGNGFTVTKDENDQTVTFSKTLGFEKVIAEVENYTSNWQYLCIDFTASANLTLGVWKGSELSNGHESILAGRHLMVIDVSNKNLPAAFTLEFYFDALQTSGTEFQEAKTVIFHSISFSETDPRASDEPNSFRTPEGFAGVAYSESDGKISYTNVAGAHWRYLQITLDNHDTEYSVLSIKVTGYNGLVMGVRVLFNDELAGQVSAGSLDVISSDAYYSKIESDNLTEIVIYLAAYGLDGVEVTGVELYLDAPAGAGTVGDVEITLNDIAMLKPADDLKDVTITAENATAAVGETPDFHVTLKDGDTDIEGKVIFEYLDGNAYKPGLPTAAGEYTIRFYYMGTREYNYSRTTTATLTITGSSEPEQHVCQHICPVDGCGKCLDANCTDAACANKCLGHEPVNYAPEFTAWYVSPTVEKAEEVEGNLVSITLKGDSGVVQGVTTVEADSATRGYIAIKYSGTATITEIGIFGTKDGGDEKSGVVAAVPGWNVTQTVGSDFSIIVAQIGSYYASIGDASGIDTITKIQVTLTGADGQTFTVYGIELLPNANHNLGTPTSVE